MLWHHAWADARKTAAGEAKTAIICGLGKIVRRWLRAGRSGGSPGSKPCR
jgi:hypothetical protein